MKQRRNIYGTLAVVVLILLISASMGYAQIPEMINYQGYLADTEGAVTGPVKMEFRIYNDSGTELWSEIHETVMVTNGIYNVKLGSVNSLGGLLFNETYFLGVKVGDDLEMTPRQPLTSVGYAFTANTALNLPNNVITSMMIQDGTISLEDVNFNYAGSTSKGGPATDLACEFCVSQTELDFVPLVRELDPQVDTLSAGKWCMSDGDVINCTENAPNASSWSLTGNAGTNPMDNFLGTTDNQPFEIRVANIRALRIERHSTTPSLSPNIIGGDLSNDIVTDVIGSTIGGGGEPSSENVITDNFGTIGGGKGNMAGNDAGTFIDASHATVGGGRNNVAQGMYATVGGGWGNQVTAMYGTIGGGGPFLLDDPSTANRVTDEYGTIGGGGGNQAGTDAETTTDATYATVGGGRNNKAQGMYATIGGGSYNQVTATYGTIAGGGESIPSNSLTASRVTDDYGTIGGGGQNLAGNDNGLTFDSKYATVSGGFHNWATGYESTVGGGAGNTASGNSATICGGNSNRASGKWSAVSGGVLANASNYGQMAYASGSFDTYGNAQASFYVLRNVTTGSTPAVLELFLNGNGVPSERITIESGRTMTFDILVVGRRESGDSMGYRCSGVIKNVNGNVSLLGGMDEKSLGGDSNFLWAVTCDADDINDALIVKVGGDDSSIIRWVATVRTAEVAWPTP